MKFRYDALDPAIILPADKNPQKMSPAIYGALKAAVEEDQGLLDDPCVWFDGERYRTISGHHRIKALVEAKQPVHCKIFEDPACNEVWYRRRVLSANRTRGESDDALLRAFLQDTFQVTGVDQRDFFQDLGFNSQEIQAYLAAQDDGDLGRHMKLDTDPPAPPKVVDPDAIKTLSLFFAHKDYPAFMRKAVDIMEKTGFPNMTDALVYCLDKVHAQEFPA